MEDSTNIVDNFDGDKLLAGYKTMSLEEVIEFLGQEHANLLNEKIKSGTLNLYEVDQICKNAYPKYPQRAEWLKSIIMLKLPDQGKTAYLRSMGVDEEQIDIVTKMDSYKEKIKNGTLTQSELKELCDMAFGKNSEESLVVFNRMNGLVKLDEIVEYDKYREQLNKEYMKEKDSDTFMVSSFTIIEGEQRKCEHSLHEIKGQESKTIMSKTFDFNESFQKNMLEPAIVDFVERNPIIESSTRKNIENINFSNYRAISETNNILNVNNVNQKYADVVASVVNQVTSIVYQQQVISQQKI